MYNILGDFVILGQECIILGLSNVNILHKNSWHYFEIPKLILLIHLTHVRSCSYVNHGLEHFTNLGFIDE